MFNHRIGSLKAVVEKYTDVRLHKYIGKKETFDKKMQSKLNYNKLNLLQGN